MIDTGLKDKVVLVTGANNPQGIGAAIARAFAAQGARLFLHYFRTAAPQNVDPGPTPGEAFYRAQGAKTADVVLAEVRNLGVEAVAWEADLGDPQQIGLLFDRAGENLGPVDVVVNNAAYWEGDTFIPTSQDVRNRLVEMWTQRPQQINAGSLDRMLAVNTRAVALIMAEFATRAVQRAAGWGRIINLSTAGAHAFPSEVSYGASKLALEGLSRSAALELGQFGITVNVISPGPVQTGWITPELEQALLPSIPLGRVGVPADIADVVIFLASEQARWVSGQRIYVGGGHGI